MTIKVAINGYGRIGRNILRAFYESGKKHDIQVVAINDLGNAETNAHLTRYDTAHGKFPGTVAVDGDYMVVNGDRIRVCAKRNPADSALSDQDKAMLLFVLKATKTPKAVNTGDLDALRAMGWTDRDILDAVNHGARNVAVDILFNTFKIENDF